MVGWSDKDTRRLCEGGGNCLKYLKMGWNRKEGRANKYFKKGGKLGQGVGSSKREGGSGIPLPTVKKSMKEKTKKV